MNNKDMYNILTSQSVIDEERVKKEREASWRTTNTTTESG